MITIESVTRTYGAFTAVDDVRVRAPGAAQGRSRHQRARRSHRKGRPVDRTGGDQFVEVNSPGSGGGSDSTKGWTHASTEEVSAGIAGACAAPCRWGA